MDMKHTVIRTDLMSGVKQPSDLVSLRFYDGTDVATEVENGVIVKLEGYESGEREVMKAVVAIADEDLNECAIDEYTNEAGKIVRGYILRSRNLFSVTKEGFVGGTVPIKGAKVGIGAGGKIDAAGTGLGTCADIEIAGRYTYYTIRIGKTETTVSTPIT